MSDSTYSLRGSHVDKSLIWLGDGIETPPFSVEARRDAGFQLRLLQRGDTLSMPISRPMPSIGKRCHELRISDRNVTWRIIYRIDPEVIVLIEVFAKKTEATPKRVIETCKERLHDYDVG